MRLPLNFVKLTFLIFVSLGLLSLSACATKPKRDAGVRSGGFEGVAVRPMGLLLTSMDTNLDGRVSREELASGRAREWSSPEFASKTSAINFAMWSKRALGSTDARPGFMTFDIDFNSVISEDEFKETFANEFNRLDKDQNGYVERSEMVFTVQGRRQGSVKKSAGQGSGKGGGQGRGKGGNSGGGRPPR